MKNIIVLKIQVWFVHLFQELRIIPNVWYKCELELADREADKMCEYFGWDLTMDENQEMIDDCMERESKLSEWEAGFIESIDRQFSNTGDLSHNQVEVLTRIWNKVTREG